MGDTSRPLVLVVDDEPVVMQYYVKVFQERGLRARLVTNVDDVFPIMEKHKDEVAAVVIDIMMPPGTRYSERNSEEGLKTGLLLWRDLRARFTELPMLILTNVTRNDTLGLFAGDPKLRVLRKLDYPPEEAAEVVNEMIAVSSKQT